MPSSLATNFERESGAASPPLPRGYQRRTPETTALYAVVRDDFETFLDDARLRHESGAGYPKFIESEFRRYLDCGILARGFARLRCPSCGFERLVAFSCKGRLCPSCWARKAADVAAHLVDRLLPEAPYRQWVLTFPWELRFLLAMDRTFLTEMLRVFLRTLFAWQRLRGRRAGIRDGRPGAVTFVQRFGSVLNLNPHFHSLAPDGLFVPGADGRLVFTPLPPPTDEDVEHLMARLAERLGALARRRMAKAQERPPWDSDDDAPVLAANADALRLPGPRLLPGMEVPPTGTGKPLCARVGGFSLHAARRVDATDRDGLERLCRYGLRSPLSLERLSIISDGQICYRLRKPWIDGRTEIVLEPIAFLRRLAALVPAPYTNLVRYHGVFANRSRDRYRLPLPPSVVPPTAKVLDAGESEDGEDVSVDDSTVAPTVRPRRLGWAQLLRRVLAVDALTCPECATSMTVLAFLTDPPVLRRILDHLALPSSPPPLAPARSPMDEAGLFVDEDNGDIEGDWPYPDEGNETARAPP
ncbi:transposase [bacterium]|nr:transposase [bacterium]